MKNFVLNAFAKLHKSVDASKDKVEQDEEAILAMKSETASLRANKPVVFEATRCFQCGMNLELPSIHFFSGHSYHSYCVPSDGKIRNVPRRTNKSRIYY